VTSRGVENLPITIERHIQSIRSLPQYTNNRKSFGFDTVQQ
jgi:hypothetical protein